MRSPVVVCAALAAFGSFRTSVLGQTCSSCDSPPQPGCPSLPLNSTLTSEAQGGIFVQWVGPPVGVCPMLGTDFTVDTSVDPPIIMLITLRNDGVEIDEYRLGRTRHPNNHSTLPNEPRIIRSVKSDWATEQANDGIVVRIGRNPDYPVLALTGQPIPPETERIAVDIKRPPVVGGNSPWSSVDIKTTNYSFGSGGSLSGSVFVEANTASTPIGGRVMGEIADNVGLSGQTGPTDPRIEAYAIGEGDVGTGTLRVDGIVYNVRLKEFPSTGYLEAAKLGSGSVVNIRGPLNGTIRVRDLVGTPAPQIVAEALDFSAGDPPPPETPRKVSSGKVIIAYAYVGQDFFPCDPCNTTGWPVEPAYVGWRDSNLWIQGDFSGQIYAWDATGAAKATVGRSTMPGAGGRLRAGGAIRTFKGNYSSPPNEFVVTNVSVDVFGDTEGASSSPPLPASRIEIGGQWGVGENINVWGNHHGDIRFMYIYGSYSTEPFNGIVHIHGHMFGLVETANLTGFTQNSGFRDNGTIIVEGDLKDTGRIQLTGHVGPQHTTEIRGNMYGRYYAYGGVQKKYAGKLRVYGSVFSGAGTPIEITGSIDSMTYNSFTQMKGAEITIDGDLMGPFKLGGSNTPPCAWTCPELDPYDNEVCGCQNPPTCSEVSGSSDIPDCSALWPASCLDDEFCSLACSCLPAPDPECNAQTNVIREDGIQHPGSLVNGAITIGGKLTSGIMLPGHIGANGSISVGRIEDGQISLQGSGGINSGILAGGRVTVVGSFTSGAIHMWGDMGGTMRIGSLAGGIVDIDGELKGGLSVINAFASGQINVQGNVSGTVTARSVAGGTFDVDGALSGALTVQTAFTSGEVRVQGNVTPTGTITFGSFGQASGGGILDIDGTLSGSINVNGQMRNALMSLVHGASGSQLNLGTTSTTWTTFLEGQTTIIDCGDINWAGTCDSTITLKGCYTPPPGEILFRSMCPADAGTLVMSFCEPAPVTCAP